ncbi:MAG: DsbA family protein, partial [Proteobacteria bacterium]|nr:DsbA family protein [Pseudomonadota bacterium]
RKFFDYLATKKYQLHVRVFLSRYRGYTLCPACDGSRLRQEARDIFVDDKNIAEPDVVAAVAESLGIDSGAVTRALQDADVKNRLRQETDAAIARGVFGSPYVVVDDEPFWGNDRLDQVGRWLETGGW